MKSCPNCRTIYGDTYNGQCHECGGPMGNVMVNQGQTVPDLQWKYMQQANQTRREADLETQMKRGRYDQVQIPESVTEVAKGLLVPREFPDGG